MPKISPEDWLEFLRFCSEFRTSEQVDNFFEVFYTFNEREEVLSRYLIVKEMLTSKKTQREIAVSHNVSIAKITRGSNQLKRVSDEFKEFIARAILGK
ncbi:MAG: trp operon repressor [Gammaproteobacteria bacterium]|nr:trp operon repressor [Gammaproteobacteria bacterium]